MSNSRPYQGYPYVNPPVVDVASISSDDAIRRHHLPRTQVDPLQKEAVSEVLDNETKRRSNPVPTVYIDLPEASGSSVADRQSPENEELEVLESSSTNKQDLDAPVLYMDLPDAGGSDVARSLEITPHEEPTFVQDTIFYNPFENRRIDCAKNESDSDSEGSSHIARTPYRPNHLDLSGAGPSAGSRPYLSTSGASFLMSKESEIYGSSGNDGYQASSILASQFPEPPPAYTETAVSSPVLVTEQPRSPSPPKTEVIVPRENNLVTPGMPHSGRKYLECQHCGVRSQSILIKENGLIAHASAISCFIICCYPIICLIYCTDILKKKNHYRPNCNQIIGVEQPFSNDKIVYLPKKMLI